MYSVDNGEREVSTGPADTGRTTRGKRREKRGVLPGRSDFHERRYSVHFTPIGFLFPSSRVKS